MHENNYCSLPLSNTGEGVTNTTAVLFVAKVDDLYTIILQQAINRKHYIKLAVDCVSIDGLG